MKKEQLSYCGRMLLLGLSGGLALLGGGIFMYGLTTRDVADILFGVGFAFLGSGMVCREYEGPVWVVRALVMIGMVALGVNILLLMGR